MSTVQVGVGLPVLSLAVYHHVVSGDVFGTAIADERIPDAAVKYIVMLVGCWCCWSSDQTVCKYIYIIYYTTYWISFYYVCIDKHCCRLTPLASFLKQVTGSKPLTSITPNDWEEIAVVLKLYHTLIKVTAEIDLFVDGLRCLGIDWHIKQYPELMESVFVNMPRKRLTAGKWKYSCT